MQVCFRHCHHCTSCPVRVKPHPRQGGPTASGGSRPFQGSSLQLRIYKLSRF